MNRMSFRFAIPVALALLIGLAPPTAAHAQSAGEAPRPVTVGLYVSPPFVMKGKDGQYTGMAIELWQSLASNLGLVSEYREFPTVRDLVDAAAAGEIDVAVTNLTVTKRRAERIDFTHPWFDGGMRLMVNEDPNTGFWAVINGLEDAGHLRAYAWLALIVLAATVALTVFDRYFDPEFPRRWRDGVAESFYSVMSVATSGRSPARKNLFGWIGRIWQGIWLACGLAVLAYVTSSVTSVMTTLSLTNQITGLADLPGRTVGVFTGSVSEDFARESGFRFLSFAHLEDAVTALTEDRIAAVIDDAPVLEYYVRTNSQEAVEVVGRLFEPDKYAFGLPHGSNLTRPLTVSLLGAHEVGLVEELRTKYFGPKE